MLIWFLCQIPPCKVLVIGAGVAGLSAIATVSWPKYEVTYL